MSLTKKDIKVAKFAAARAIEAVFQFIEVGNVDFAIEDAMVEAAEVKELSQERAERIRRQVIDELFEAGQQLQWDSGQDEFWYPGSAMDRRIKEGL